jgi:hypothetical protein
MSHTFLKNIKNNYNVIWYRPYLERRVAQSLKWHATDRTAASSEFESR